MVSSTTPIIRHISYFLIYCKQKGYSHHTQENYKRYLHKFILWLKENKKENLKPYELTIEDIDSYKVYLSRSQGEKGHPLKKVSQNYYLIALRALLGYFVARDVVCIPQGKITLPKDFRVHKTIKFLDFDQIGELLGAPNTKTKIQTVYGHNTSLINNYKITNNKGKIINQSPIWHIAEDAIKKEVIWLKNNIPVLQRTKISSR